MESVKYDGMCGHEGVRFFYTNHHYVKTDSGKRGKTANPISMFRLFRPGTENQNQSTRDEIERIDCVRMDSKDETSRHRVSCSHPLDETF